MSAQVPPFILWINAGAISLGVIVAAVFGLLNYKLSVKRRKDDLYDRRVQVAQKIVQFRSNVYFELASHLKACSPSHFDKGEGTFERNFETREGAEAAAMIYATYAGLIRRKMDNPDAGDLTLKEHEKFSEASAALVSLSVIASRSARNLSLEAHFLFDEEIARRIREASKQRPEEMFEALSGEEFTSLFFKYLTLAP